MAQVSPFHIAIPVHNLAACRTFYREILNCEEGRSSEHWVDFNLFGHQLVIHYKAKREQEDLHSNPVDGKNVPVPHYGVVLPWETFDNFSKELKSKGVSFIIEPISVLKGKWANKPLCFSLIQQETHWNSKLLKIWNNCLPNKPYS